MWGTKSAPDDAWGWRRAGLIGSDHAIGKTQPCGAAVNQRCQTSSRKVVRRPVSSARRHRAYVLRPKLRTIVEAFSSTSLVVMLPLIMVYSVANPCKARAARMDPPVSRRDVSDS